MLEWWWDTTNTFHFSYGELTITPLDFNMLTGLPFTGVSVPLDLGLKWGDPLVSDYLGPVADTFPRYGKEVSLEKLLMDLRRHETTDVQKVCILALVLVSELLGCDKRAHVLVRYLPTLIDIDHIWSYNWAALGYARLIFYLRWLGVGGSLSFCCTHTFRALDLSVHYLAFLLLPAGRMLSPPISSRLRVGGRRLIEKN